MKKLIAVTSVLAFFVAASANAKTEGSYLGLNLNQSSLKTYRHSLSSSNDEAIQYENSNTGIGVDYKYAFNINKFFVAPGVFYDKIDAKTTELDGVNRETFAVKNRHGFKVDLGYDITDTFAAYVTAGVGYVAYKTSSADFDGAGSQGSFKGSTPASIFGFGIVNHINENVSIGAEYNTQKFSVRDTSHYNGSGFAAFGDTRVRASIDMYKLTVAYHF